MADTQDSLAAGLSLAADEIHQVRQYEKLVAFRDAVVSGLHPRIKPSQPSPRNLVNGATTSVQLPSSQDASSSSSIRPSENDAAVAPSRASAVSQRATRRATLERQQKLHNTQSFTANAQKSATATVPNLPGLGQSQATVGDNPSAMPEIDPVLLEKPDFVIKAEIQLQRQRLERALQEQVDARRNGPKVHPHSSELPAELDLNDVFARAMELAQQTAPLADDNVAADDEAANGSASSDSFDNNTFYSSRHDTPEPVQAAEEPDVVEESQMEEGSPYEPPLNIDSPPHLPEVIPAVPAALSSFPVPSPAAEANFFAQHQWQHMTAAHTREQLYREDISNQAAATAPAQTQHLQPNATQNNSAPRSVETNRVDSSQGSRDASRSGDSIYGRSSAQSRLDNNPSRLRNPLFGGEVAPVVRAHSLSPVAPQPAQISPLATAQLGAGGEAGYSQGGTPAQVAALRKEASGTSSQDSSPQAAQGSERRRAKKKNKRKADRALDEAADMPYIKPEPRSPSPVAAPAYPRPYKRQRQGPRHGQAPSFDGSRNRQAIDLDSDHYGGYATEEYRREEIAEESRLEWASQAPYTGPRSSLPRLPAEYVRSDANYGPETSLPRPPAEYARIDKPGVHGRALQGQPSPSYISREYASRDGLRPEMQTYASYDRPRREVHTVHEPHWSSMPLARSHDRSPSPVAYERLSTNMGPPRMALPSCVVVDEFGREYMEPARAPTVIRRSEVPPVRDSDVEVIYERAPPPNAASRGPESFEETYIYRKASPNYAAPRRLTSHAVGSLPEYRSYRERDYSLPGPAPAQDYPHSRPQSQRAMFGEGREHAARPINGGPPQEPVHHRSPPDYERRPVDHDPRACVPARAVSVRPTETIRYEIARAPERRFADETVRVITRAATARPMESMGLEAFGDRAAFGTQRAGGGELAGVRHYSEAQSELRHHPRPPSTSRAVSARPPGGPAYPYEDAFTVPAQPYARPRPAGNEEVVYRDPRLDEYTR